MPVVEVVSLVENKTHFLVGILWKAAQVFRQADEHRLNAARQGQSQSPTPQFLDAGILPDRRAIALIPMRILRIQPGPLAGFSGLARLVESLLRRVDAVSMEQRRAVVCAVAQLLAFAHAQPPASRLVLGVVQVLGERVDTPAFLV